MRTTTVVIGAGQAGLAMSRLLSERSIDHVVLERREVANSWRTERWDSLRLLTPNWQCRLPGMSYEGDDPDGFMTMPEVVDFMVGYAERDPGSGADGGHGDLGAPLPRTATASTTDHDEWQCRTVVLATGAFNVPRVPDLADAIPPSVISLTPMTYRNPDELAEGGVLVVGASASGVQIAHEIQQSGRPVTLAVGEHVRGPRSYRGRDIQWWMEAAGVLDERYDEVDDIVRARRVPSMQLAGSPERATFDLNALTAIGVELVGRLAGVRGSELQFSGSLRNKCELADLKLGRLLDTIDEWALAAGIDDSVPPPHRFAPTRLPDPPPLGLDLGRGAIQTIIWATGYRPDYSWLDVDVLDPKGMVRHDGGVVVDSPGMYVIGMPFLRRRKSSFIDGARADAEDLIVELAAFLDRQAVGVAGLSSEDDRAGRRALGARDRLPRPAELAAVTGQAQVGEAPEQGREGDPRLQPSERCAEAEVDAVAEGQVRTRRPPEVEGVRIGVDLGVAVGGGEADDDLLAVRDVGAADRERFGRHAERRVRDRCGVPEELLDRGRHLIEVGKERVELVGVIEQGHDRVPDVGRGGVVPGDDQLEEARQQLLIGQPLVRRWRRPARSPGRHQVTPAWPPPARASDPTMPSDARTASGGGLSPHGRSKRAEPVVELWPARLGHAEQRADDPKGQRMREALDEVDDRLGSVGVEVVEQVVGDGLDRGFERRDPGRKEGLGDEATQPGVVRRVHVEHVAGELRSGQAARHHVRIIRERGDHVLRDPPVVQRLAGGVVAQDDPRVVPVGEPHRLHGALRAHRLEVRRTDRRARRDPTRPRSAWAQPPAGSAR